MSKPISIPSTLLEELRDRPFDEQIDLLTRHGPLVDVVRSLVAATVTAGVREAGHALSLAERAVALADHVDDPLARAQSRRARARALAYAGRFEDALAVSYEAVDIAGEADEPVEAARARLASMHALGELGRWPEAISAGRTARDALVANDEPALAARADINLGIILQKSDKPEEALASFERAESSVDDGVVRGALENARAEAMLAINDFPGAESAFQRAQIAFAGGGGDVMVAIAEGNLADLAARQGRLDAALALFERARRRLAGTNAPAVEARLRAEQAEARMFLGLPSEARHGFESVLPELDAGGLRREAARARWGLGLAALRLERFAEAETALTAAGTAYQELGDVTAKARVDVTRAELALRNGHVDESRRLATSALGRLAERPAETAIARFVMARIGVASDESEAALADLSVAESISRRLELAPLLADVLTERGRILRGLGRTDDAIETLVAATEQIEQIRGSLQAHRFRAAFLGARRRAFDELAAAFIARGGADVVANVFHTAERARSRSLLDRITGTVLPPVDRDDAGDATVASLRSERAALERDLNALYSCLADAQPASAARRETWRRVVRERGARLDTIETRLASIEGTAWHAAVPVALEELQASLHDGELLLVYFAVDGVILAVAVERERATLCTGLLRTSEAAEAGERLRFQIDRALRPGALSGGRGARRLDDARRELSLLNEHLLAPFTQRIDDARRLTVVPHGTLHRVPFHALWDGERHLVERQPVQVIPSASLLVHGRDRPAGSGGRPLVIGVADPVVPNVRDEACEIAALLGCAPDELVLDGDATVARVRTAMEGASVVHFAGHGRFVDGDPRGSGLRLGDRWLTPAEILDLRLRASLVSLSGCETGRHDVGEADELVGLMQSFLSAGAAALLVSLWKVDDAMARRFMARVYSRGEATWRAGGASLPEYVAEVQNELLADHPHPALWAPFALVGRG